MLHSDELLRRLNAFEEAAEQAVAFMRRVADEWEIDGNSPSWMDSLPAYAQGRPRDPYSTMWNKLMAARDYATEHGFSEVAKAIIPGLIQGSTLASMIQRAHDEGQQKIKEGLDPELALSASTANHFKAQVDFCVEKVLEARRAKEILNKASTEHQPPDAGR